MLYHSTRSEAHFVDSAEAVLEGLAPDGGLYMPESPHSTGRLACGAALRKCPQKFLPPCCRIFPIWIRWFAAPIRENLKPKI